MKIAIIDLGTNTSNLLIAEASGAEYKILHQSKHHVRLGDDKIKADEISSEATQRAVQSFLNHKKIIESFHTEKVCSIATSAVRTAINKISLLEEIGEKTGYVVKVVSGEKEAELIFKGVLLAVKEFAEPVVILDIGGGSNELILASKKEILWKESRATGMSRVIHKFVITDPIRTEEIKQLQEYFSLEHQLAFEKCRDDDVKILIGCSGAFDTIADIIENVNPGEKQRTTQKISINDFALVYELLINSTRIERLAMKGMDMVRVDLIVPAVILINQLISETGIQGIIQTDFALREGVLYEFMNR